MLDPKCIKCENDRELPCCLRSLNSWSRVSDLQQSPGRMVANQGHLQSRMLVAQSCGVTKRNWNLQCYSAGDQMHNEQQAVQVNNLINVGFFIISNCKVFFGMYRRRFSSWCYIGILTGFNLLVQTILTDDISCSRFQSN